MSDKKHIDRLFQEKLKDFEATPDKAVWDNIHSQLNEQDNKKVIPLWWKFAGIAAGLLLLLTVGNFVFNNSANKPTVVDTKDFDKTKPKIKDKNVINTDVSNTNNDITDLNNNNQSEKESVHTNYDASKTNSTVKSNVNDNYSNQLSKTTKNNQSNTVLHQYKNQLTTVNNNKVLIDEKLNQQPKPDTKNDTENPVVYNPKNNDGLANAKHNKVNDIDEKYSENLNNTKEKLAVTDTLKNTVEQPLVVTEKPEKQDLTEDLIANNDINDEKEKETINRWQVSPNLAPVYFNTIGEGSSIHEELNKNQKNGKTNMSYGINVSYAVNNRLSIKSGVNKVNLGYSTKDILIYENVGTTGVGNTGLVRNIKLNDGLQNLTFVSGNNLAFAQSPSIIPGESFSSLEQDMSYYEIPLELKYKLSNKKLNVSLVGGFSTFILNDNKVSFVLNGESTELGEATNLNSTSFSANLGFGFDFDIFKNVNFNLDPMFKYQINTFNNTSGNFQPYFIGIYTGLNYKF